MTRSERDAVMVQPPVDFGQVLAWLDAWSNQGGAWPDQGTVDAARALPRTTSLEAVLRVLGVDPDRLTGAVVER